MPLRLLLGLTIVIVPVLRIAAQEPGTFLIEDVSVIPMSTETIMPNRDVLIVDGRFEAMGDHGTIRPPEGVVTIDGSDKYLIPGLMDLHVHFNGGRKAQDDMAFLYLANGVTTVLSMSGSRGVLRMRDEVREGKMVAPRVYTTTPIIGNFQPHPDTAEEAEQMIEEYAADGYDFVKVYNEIPEVGYWAIMKTAKRLGIPVVGHAVRSVGIEGAIESGQHIAHMEEFLYGYFQEGLDESRIRPLAKRLKEEDISVIATLVAYHTIVEQLDDYEAELQAEGVAYMPEPVTRTYLPENNTYLNRFDKEELDNRLRPHWQFLQKLTRIFNEEGVTILAGTDAIMEIVTPGFSLHRELRELVEAGMSEYEALEAATVAAAEFLGIDEELGTIEVNKSADAVLLRANPLSDIDNTTAIAGVLTRGEWLSRDAIDDRLADIKTRAGM